MILKMRNYFKLFRNASNRLINLIFAEDENENKDLLSQFFSLKFKKEKKKDN